MGAFERARSLPRKRQPHTVRLLRERPVMPIT
jgi:hypothetical protein